MHAHPRLLLPPPHPSHPHITHSSNKADLDYNAVQRGDAEMAQKLWRVVRSCVEMGDANPIVQIHDQGAGGNCNVVKEIIYPLGAEIDVRAVKVGVGRPAWVCGARTAKGLGSSRPTATTAAAAASECAGGWGPGYAWCMRKPASHASVHRPSPPADPHHLPPPPPPPQTRRWAMRP